MLRAIEQKWLDRADTQNYPGRHTQTYRKLEVGSFVGAMATLDAAGYAIPMSWTIMILSGRNVVEGK